MCKVEYMPTYSLMTVPSLCKYYSRKPLRVVSHLKAIFAKK